MVLTATFYIDIFIPIGRAIGRKKEGPTKTKKGFNSYVVSIQQFSR